jgi:hypothetical protein
MDEAPCDRSLKALAGLAGRRDIVGAMGLAGTTVLAGLGPCGAADPVLAGKSARLRGRRRRNRAQRARDRVCRAIGGETCAGCKKTCDAACGDCSFCYHQTDGPPLCAGGASWAGCPDCTATSDCPPGAHCVTGQTFGASGTTERLGGSCEYSVGLCLYITPCVP